MSTRRYLVLPSLTDPKRPYRGLVDEDKVSENQTLNDRSTSDLNRARALSALP